MEQREAGFKQQHPMNDERRIQIDHNSLPATLERYSIISAVLHTLRTDALHKFRDRLLTIITTPTHSHSSCENRSSSLMMRLDEEILAAKISRFLCANFLAVPLFFTNGKVGKVKLLPTLIQLKFEGE